jgi:anti-anti-sigma factor
MTVRELRSSKAYVLSVEGSLRWPDGRELRGRVRTLLRRGDRHILLDVGRVSQIDAAGIGELVRAYNMATAVDGSLRIVGATGSVREILERVGLFGLLSAEWEGR